ncbi:SAM-dependent methyltransferase [Actinoplanes sp. NPDC023801]|uniref:SAM-dependent methyltransferase n=1 Tax=Actinoplanes sp. NPDC023801 TaxID=3154595 RepID=UPI0033FC39A7
MAEETTRLPVRESRSFLQRAVRFLAEEARVDQFLDIGAGVLTAGSTHEVAQRKVPHARIVYVDSDPAVDARFTGSPEGAIRYLRGDLREPRTVLGDPRLKETLDLDRPVALILVAVLDLLPDHRQAVGVVRELLAALPSGSYLAATSFTLDHRPADPHSRPETHPRTRAQFAEYFTGLGLIGPGIVAVSEWLPEVPAHQRPPADAVALYGAVGRKP